MFFSSIGFSPSVGEEIILGILEQPEYASEFAQIRKLSLYAKTGVVRTSAGIVAFIIWSAYGPRGHIVDYEHPLNLFNIETIKLLSSVSQQSHLKVFIVNSATSHVTNHFQFHNTFCLDELAAGISRVIGHEPETDFQATQVAMEREFTLEELKNA